MAEKRQFERVLVENVWLEIGSSRYCVVDISEHAFRIIGSGEELFQTNPIRATLCFGEEGTALRETIECRLMRGDNAFNVFNMPPRPAGWLNFVKGFGALHANELDQALFD